MLNEKDIIAINAELDTGKVVNRSSLGFAIAYAKKTTNWTKALAYLTRAILIDHVFEDGNKRTVAAIIIAESYHQGYGVDRPKLLLLIEKVLKKNITNIRTIEEMIKDVVK